jgi:hypothetical protein
MKTQLHYSIPQHYLEIKSELHGPAVLFPGEMSPGIHWIVRCVGERLVWTRISKNSRPYRDTNSDHSVI